MNSDLRIEIYDKDTFGGDDLEGVVSINLTKFEQQNKVDKWYDLQTPEGEPEQGSVHLRVHCIWSKFRYFTDLYNSTDIQISKLEKDINELNRYFEIFKRPFGIIIYGEVNNIFEKRILERSEDVDQYLSVGRKTVFASPRGKSFMAGMTERVENVIRGTLKRSQIEWSFLTKFMMYSALIFSTLSLLDRSDFVNVNYQLNKLFVSVVVWILFIRDKKLDILEYMKWFLIGVLLTIVYDFFWLFFHYNVDSDN